MEIKKEAIEQNSDLCSYSPKTSPGRRLLEIRTKIIASGEHMLDWDEIEKEVAERRGRFENSTRRNELTLMREYSLQRRVAKLRVL